MREALYYVPSCLWGVRGEGVKESVDLYWSTAKVGAAGSVQAWAVVLGTETSDWTQPRDLPESYDRAMIAWGAVIKYDYQAAKAGGDGWHADKGEDKLETWAEMGTTVVLTVATGGGAAAVKGGIRGTCLRRGLRTRSGTTVMAI